MKISGFEGGTYHHMQRMTTDKLSSTQEENLKEIISKYDPENLSTEDRKEMHEEMKAAGIPKGRGMISIMKEAGFKGPRKAGQGMIPPKCDKPDKIEKMNSQFEQLLNQLTSEEKDLTLEEIQEKLQEFKEQFYYYPGRFVNYEA